MTAAVGRIARPAVPAISPAIHGPAVGYRAELDGVRAVAIGLVLADHLLLGVVGQPIADALGWAGVTLFFGLSGYLITGILVTERERTGTIALRSFYWRRFVRLAPGLLVLVAAVTAAMVIVGGSLAGVVAALTYSANWIRVTGTDIDPLTHTWTLAVEEQFYLLWPMVLLLRRERAVAVLAIAVGIATYALVPASVAGFTTTACAVPVMAGALLSRRGSRWLRPLASLAPFGKRAYSIYLWNWPLTLWLGPIVGLAATLAIAEASYRVVERPLVARWRDRLAEDRRTNAVLDGARGFRKRRVRPRDVGPGVRPENV